jgi:nicastrin
VTTATFHAAVDPALSYNGKKFEVSAEKMASPMHARTRLWAEAHWDGDPGRMRVYYVENEVAEWLMLLFGIVVTAATYGAVRWAAPRCEERYKQGYFKDD